jgi:hypothetical protein
MRTPQKLPLNEKPVESHSNDFFPVGSLYCISLLRLDQVKGKLEISHKDTLGCSLQRKQTISKLLSAPFQHLLNTLSLGSLPIFMLTCRITLSDGEF